MDGLELFQLAQNLAWVVLGVVAVRLWRQVRTAAAGWVAVAFGVLGVVVLAADAASRLYGDELPVVATKVIILAIVVFPFALFRFSQAFEETPSPVLNSLVVSASALLAAWTIALPSFPQPGEPRSTVITAYTLVFVVSWALTLSIVGARLWRGGAGQPTLQRRRMRLLSLSSVLLALNLVASGAQGGAEPTTSYLIATGLLSLAAALLFIVAFAPPPTLRVGWRQPEERELNEAAVLLMSASTAREVTEIVLPHVARLLGASTVVLRDPDGDVVGHVGRIEETDDDGDHVVRVPLVAGELAVAASRYTPFFAGEEVALTRRLGLLADLALARSELMVREREARAELETTNAELEAFVYSASHDLKSPLIAMLGYLEVVREEMAGRLDEQTAWYLQRMTVNGEFMQELIRDLLDLSRVGRMDTEPDRVDVTALVRDLAVEVHRGHEQATVTVEDRIPELWINPTRARQLFGNLVQNAAKHGGRHDITVRVHVVERDAETGIVIGIDDDGRGIPTEYAEKVFGVFERLEVDEAVSGTGIGLAVCRKIAQSAGGDLTLAPSEHGAHFRLALPPSALARPRNAPTRADRVPDGGPLVTRP